MERVSSFKYLGTVLDEKLSLTENVDYFYKKAQQRLFLLRTLGSFNVRKDIVESVYRSLIESILVFKIVTWYAYRNLTLKNRARLVRVVSLAEKIIGSKQNQLSDLYHQSVKIKSIKIIRDQTHPLNYAFETLPSGRQLKLPLARKNCFKFKRSFIPSAMTTLNSEFH